MRERGWRGEEGGEELGVGEEEGAEERLEGGFAICEEERSTVSLLVATNTSQGSNTPPRGTVKLRER